MKRGELKRNPDILELDIAHLCEKINLTIKAKAKADYMRDTSVYLDRKGNHCTHKGETEYWNKKAEEYNAEINQAYRTLVHWQEELKELRGKK